MKIFIDLIGTGLVAAIVGARHQRRLAFGPEAELYMPKQARTVERNLRDR